MKKTQLLKLLKSIEADRRCCRNPPSTKRTHSFPCAVPDAIRDLEAELAGTLRVCIRCGCHERDACMIGRIGCHWISPIVDLCSVCADKTGIEPPSAANGFGFFKRAKPCAPAQRDRVRRERNEKRRRL